MGSFLSNRALPLRLTSLAIALLVFTFVVLPIGAMLARSLVVSGPAPLADLARMTEAAIALLPEDGRDAALDRWVAASDPRQRMEAIAAALALSEQAVPWDRTAAFDIQIAAAEATLAALPAEGRGAVEERIPLATVMLHRRIPLAFQVKDALGEEAFDALRSGVHDRYGWDHYLAVVQEPRLRHAAANSLSLAAVTTPVTLALAFLIAFGINRGGVAGAGIARWAVFIPLVSPPVIIATATVLLFGRSGLITHGLLDQGLGWIDASTQNM
jgi:iron(III) transport system permease protein